MQSTACARSPKSPGADLSLSSSPERPFGTNFVTLPPGGSSGYIQGPMHAPSMTAEVSESLPQLIRPPALQKGDAIGVVAPSYSPREGWLMRGVKALERAGYIVLLDPEIGEVRRFQRREDERNCDEMQALVADVIGHGAPKSRPKIK